jgi:hypothetical protein
MITTHALLILAISRLVAYILQLLVTITMHVPKISVMQESVFTKQCQFLLLQMHAPFLLATQRMVSIPILKTVMITTHAQPILVILQLELANMMERIVMITMHVPSILAMLIQENAYIPQWFVLM